MYVDINEVELLRFNNCKDCTKCCYKLFAPLVLEDFEKVYKYFPIFFVDIEYLRPVMLISDGKNGCRYLEGEKCTIYKNRPPACKIYPFTPWYDKILLDLSCDSVGIEGDLLPLDDFENSSFYDERFENISEKIEKTKKWVERKNLRPFLEFEGFMLYKIEEIKDKFDEMVMESYERFYFKKC